MSGAMEQNTTMLAELTGAVRTLIGQLRGEYSLPGQPADVMVSPSLPEGTVVGSGESTPKRRGRKPAPIVLPTGPFPDAPPTTPYPHSQPMQNVAVEPAVSFDTPASDDFLDMAPVAAKSEAPKPLTAATVRDELVKIGDNKIGQKILLEQGKVDTMRDLKPENFAAVVEAARKAQK